MRDAHPVAAVLLAGSLLPVIVQADAAVLGSVVVALLVTGLVWGGSRRAALGFGLVGALVAVVWWALVALLAPPRAPGPALFALGPWRLGPGVELGGPVSVAGLTWLGTATLRAVAVCLLLGLLGQLVSARDQVRLTRSSAGMFTPALAPAACLGEAAALAAADGRRFRLGPTGWLTAWFTHAQNLGHQLNRDRPAPLWADTVRLLAWLAAAVALVSVPAAGGVRGLVMVGWAVVLVGLLLPGTPAEVRQVEAWDAWLFLAGAALVASWFIPVPWVAGALVWLLPLPVLVFGGGHE